MSKAVSADAFHVAIIPIVTALVGPDALSVWGGDCEANISQHYISCIRLISKDVCCSVDSVVTGIASRQTRCFPRRFTSTEAFPCLRVIGCEEWPLSQSTVSLLTGNTTIPIGATRHYSKSVGLALDLSYRAPFSCDKWEEAVRSGPGILKDRLHLTMGILIPRFSLPVDVYVTWRQVA